MRHCSECDSTQFTQVLGTDEADYGLDAPVILDGVTHYTCQKCGDTSVGIPRPAGIVPAIATQLAHKPSLLTPREVRFLRRHLGLTQSEFGRRLSDVTQVTVARWEAKEEARALPKAVEKLLRIWVLTAANAKLDAISAEIVAHHDKGTPQALHLTSWGGGQAA